MAIHEAKVSERADSEMLSNTIDGKATDRADVQRDMALLETFASLPRMGIIKLVSKKPSTVQEIAQEIGLKPISVRFHLQKLTELGFIKPTKGRGRVGRPRLIYRATDKRLEVAFPPRNYLHLASVLMRVLLKSGDTGRIKMDAAKVGKEIGSELGRSLRRNTGVERWDGNLLKKHLVEGMLEEFGTRPETVFHTSKSIQYRLNNCPFRELAIQYPDIICEELDDAINVSILRELDDRIDWRKLKCIGHGDSYCEYVASWSLSKLNKAAIG
jgi:predicted ArsR family transcriptional regulator